jgi:hypothetical protein
MTAGANAVLARTKDLGISLSLGRAADGSVCILWRGEKGIMTADLKADIAANKPDLVGHLKSKRKAEVMAAFAAVYDRMGNAYPREHGAGLPDVARQLPDLFTCVDNLESEAEAAATAYQSGCGSFGGFASALEAWERCVLDAVASLANIRNGKACTDCGSEAPISLVTTLGQRICSRCVRSDYRDARKRAASGKKGAAGSTRSKGWGREP